jgi:chondroitin AC lyase
MKKLIIRLCKFLFLSVFVILVFNLQIFSQELVTKTLSKNLSEYLLTEDHPKLNLELSNMDKDFLNGDQVINQLFQKRNSNLNSIGKILTSLKEDGTWTDINYNDRENSGWELKTHVDRILLITKEYLSKDSKYYQDKNVDKKIHQTLAYWFKYMPQNSNWWYNEIGIPKTLGEVFVLLKSELSAQEYKDGLKVMAKSNFGMTGQNKVWLAGNMFYKALLTNDDLLAQRARDTIVSEIKVSGNEGIKPDFSFQQHGAQQQFGNYGLAFLSSMASWANVFNNTSFRLNQEELSILRNLFAKGYNQIVWKGYFDTNSLGRQFFKHVQEQKALATAFAAYDLMKVDAEQQDLYKDFIKRNYTKTNEPFLNKITNFYNSDMSIYRSEDWFNSIKMSSTRVIGSETGNNENLKGYYLGDGVSYINVTGKEYDDIFPLWNWRNLPGVTCFETNEPLKMLTFKGYKNNNDFAGSISNKMNGITSFILNRDSLTAKKSYFYINGQMVCLGAGISTLLNEPVTTTLNQTWLNGNVTYFTDKKLILNPESSIKSQKIKWVNHDNITYVPLNNTKLDVSNQTHTGSWHQIIAKYPDEIEKGEIFTVKVSSEMKPKNASYAYAILPNYQPAINNNVVLKFEILQNNEAAQVVKSKDNKIFLFTIFKPIKEKIEKLGEIDFKQPGLYQIENISKIWEITLSDPTQNLKTINVIFNGINNQFEMPNGLHKGKAIHQELKK